MDLVTMTCKRDAQQMLLQAESIQKFLAPCTHHVVLNDPTPDYDYWKELLTPFYTNHKLVLSSTEPFTNDWGWLTQQINKLRIAKDLDDDYLILDTKNFFIKPTDIEEWRNILGSGKVEIFEENLLGNPWKDTIQIYADKLNIDRKFEWCLSAETPFAIKTDVVRNFKELDSFHEWFFLGAEHWTGEFALYTILVYDLMKAGVNVFDNKMPNIKHITFWEHMDANELLNDHYWKHCVKTDCIKALGIHRLFLQKIDNGHVDFINDKLAELDFKFRFQYEHSDGNM